MELFSFLSFFSNFEIRRPTFGGQRQNRGQTPSPVVGAATGASPAPPPPAIIVWDVAQLSPFDRAKGDMVLGKGAYGTVRLFRDKASRTPLAVKNFTLPSDPDQMVRRAQAIQDEANIQSILGKGTSVILQFQFDNKQA